MIVHDNADTHFLTPPVPIGDEVHWFRQVLFMHSHEIAGVGNPWPWTVFPGVNNGEYELTTGVATNGCLFAVSAAAPNTTNYGVGVIGRGDNIFRRVAPSPNPGRLVVDATHIYWVDKTGFIGRVKLP